MRCVVFELAGDTYVLPPPPAVRRWFRPHLYVRPHLEYCLQAVGPYMKKTNTLERIQRKASKIVKGMKRLSYEESLKRLKLIKIEDRAKRGDLIETYKIMTGKLKVDPNHFFKKDLATRTRGNHLKLLKPRFCAVVVRVCRSGGWTWSWWVGSLRC